jgi:phage N-6-adenine-methyltransferase
MAGQGQDMKQGVYKTPAAFMAMVRMEFGPLTWDLAACRDNTQAGQYLTETDNSLSEDRPWRRLGGWLWLNPPYGNIGAWAAKCAAESEAGAKILFLVPASVGSDWYAEHVHEKAEVRYLRPRLAFEFLYPLDYKDKHGNPSPKAGMPNKDPYPKDLLLAIYDRERRPRAFPWDWRKAPPEPKKYFIPFIRFLNGRG